MGWLTTARSPPADRKLFNSLEESTGCGFAAFGAPVPEVQPLPRWHRDAALAVPRKVILPMGRVCLAPSARCSKSVNLIVATEYLE